MIEPSISRLTRYLMNILAGIRSSGTSRVYYRVILITRNIYLLDLWKLRTLPDYVRVVRVAATMQRTLDVISVRDRVAVSLATDNLLSLGDRLGERASKPLPRARPRDKSLRSSEVNRSWRVLTSKNDYPCSAMSDRVTWPKENVALYHISEWLESTP